MDEEEDKSTEEKEEGAWDFEEVTSDTFFAVLISAPTVGHILHLKTKSFAQHKALQKFYEDSRDIADAVIETYQGWKKEIVEYDCDALCMGADEEPLEYLEGLRVFIQGVRYKIIPRKETHIHNELDNFVSLIDSTVYKLTFLK